MARERASRNAWERSGWSDAGIGGSELDLRQAAAAIAPQHQQAARHSGKAGAATEIGAHVAGGGTPVRGGGAELRGGREGRAAIRRARPPDAHQRAGGADAAPAI